MFQPGVCGASRLRFSQFCFSFLPLLRGRPDNDISFGVGARDESYDLQLYLFLRRGNMESDIVPCLFTYMFVFIKLLEEDD